MNPASRARPAFAGDGSVYALWVAAGESPEWIATRTDSLLGHLQAQFDIAHWETWKGDRWMGPIDQLAEIVRSCVVRDEGTADNNDGKPLPMEGYSLIVSGGGPRMAFHIRVAAGAVTAGRRLPRHHLSIRLHEVIQGGVTGAVADEVCAAAVHAWHPSMLELADPQLRQTARRGGWKGVVG